MSRFPPNILSHFQPFHDWLDEVVRLSNVAFPEGGVDWRVDFSKRKSDLDNQMLVSLVDKQRFSGFENTRVFKRMWSKFYWNAAGLGGSLQDLTLPDEWSAAENKLTLNYLHEVEPVAALFVAAQASGYWVSCEEDPVGMRVKSVTLFGSRVLEHDVHWSID